MDQFIDQLSLNFEDSLSPTQYIAYILLCAALLFLLAIVYRRFGQSMSNRTQLSRVLMIVGLTTFIIISIVKSSLALSLGLVGALSIVRFRTAIKEPEELGYFFMAISIGLGMGANQLLPTLIGFGVLMLIVILQSKGGSSSITQNLLIHLDSDAEQRTLLIENITKELNESVTQLDLKRVNHNDTSISMNFLVKLKSMEDLNQINSKLIAINPKINVTFIDNTL